MTLFRNLLMPLPAMLVLLTSACNMLPGKPPVPTDANILHVYSDGSMKLNNRDIDPENVVIYPDGFGGERAALKMRVPLHPDYYRDTIIVERESGTAGSALD